MDQAGKIDTMCLESETRGFATDTSSAIILDNTDNESTPISEESVIRGYALSPRVDTEIIPKVSDEIDISKTNNNILQEIPNMTPYLAQPENNSEASAKVHMSSLIESHSQMRPSLEALPLPIGGIGTIPIVASTLMSPLSAYMLLTLLIIAVMWFVILRRTWNIGTIYLNLGILINFI